MSSERDDEGQVSEVGGLDPDAADAPIQPDSAVAGAPDVEPGEVNESTIGSHQDPEAEVEAASKSE